MLTFIGIVLYSKEIRFNNIIFPDQTNYRNLPGSPFPRKKLLQTDGFWNLQHPPDAGGGGGSGSNSASPSPLLCRKRFQTTIPVNENQYDRLQGNTSPIGMLFICFFV